MATLEQFVGILNKEIERLTAHKRFLSSEEEDSFKHKISSTIILPSSFIEVDVNLSGSYQKHYDSESTLSKLKFFDQLFSLTLKSTGYLIPELMNKLFHPTHSKKFFIDPSSLHTTRELTFQWDLEEFLKEASLDGQILNKLEMKKFLDVCQPPRFDDGTVDFRWDNPSHVHPHGISLKSTPQGISVENLDGAYLGCARKFTENIHPDYALLSIEKKDEHRLRGLNDRHFRLFEIISSLRNPQLCAHVNFINGTFPNQSRFAIIPFARVKSYEDDLGFSLFQSNDLENTKITKILYAVSSSEKLTLFQTLAQQIENFDSGLLLHKPYLSDTTAKEYLDQEIETIANFLEKGMYIEKCENKIERLVDEHLIIKSPSSYSIRELIHYFQQQGITLSESKSYRSNLEELFYYFIASYRKDPTQSLRSYRYFFVTQDTPLDINSFVHEPKPFKSLIQYPTYGKCTKYWMGRTPEMLGRFGDSGNLYFERKDKNDVLSMTICLQKPDRELFYTLNTLYQQLGIEFPSSLS